MEKLLGVRIDSNLTFRDHVYYICTIINEKLALLRGIKQYIDIPTSILYCNDFVLHYMDCCKLVWSSSNDWKCFKRARLELYLVPHTKNINSSFKRHEWETVDIRHKRLGMTYKALNNLCPP